MDLTTAAAAAATITMDSQQSLLCHFTSFKSESGQVIWVAQSSSWVQDAKALWESVLSAIFNLILEVGQSPQVGDSLVAKI